MAFIAYQTNKKTGRLCMPAGGIQGSGDKKGSETGKPTWAALEIIPKGTGGLHGSSRQPSGNTPEVSRWLERKQSEIDSLKSLQDPGGNDRQPEALKKHLYNQVIFNISYHMDNI